MKLIDGKSFLLGIGIGIIITSILGFIFFLGYQPQLSDGEIISRARRLGMVDRFENGGNIRRNQDGSVTFISVKAKARRGLPKDFMTPGLLKAPSNSRSC